MAGQVVELQSAKLHRYFNDLKECPFVTIVVHDAEFVVYYAGLTESDALGTIQELLIARQSKETNGSEED